MHRHPPVRRSTGYGEEDAGLFEFGHRGNGPVSEHFFTAHEVPVDVAQEADQREGHATFFHCLADVCSDTRRRRSWSGSVWRSEKSRPLVLPARSDNRPLPPPRSRGPGRSRRNRASVANAQPNPNPIGVRHSAQDHEHHPVAPAAEGIAQPRLDIRDSAHK
jgi:hypothetical protein